MRLFVSLRPPAAVTAHLAAAAAGLRTTDVAQWHITLAFLGEVPDPQPVAAELASLTHPPFDLQLQGSGTFRSQGGLVYAGVTGDVDALHRLAADVQAACRRAGLRLEDRPYRPHLTVARRSPRDATVLAGYQGRTWTADEIELVRSHLRKRAVHEVLERFALDG